MRTLGILGGLAPDVTAMYYDGVIRNYQANMTDGSYPRILINSLDLQLYNELFSADRIPELTAFLSEGLESLVDAGADMALIAANSPHLVFDELRQRISIPLISIVDSVADAAERLKLRKLGLLGNRFTMQSDFYQRRFAARGIAIVTPGPQEQEYIIKKYTSVSASGVELEASKGLLARVAQDLIRRSEIDGLIVGGCERPSLFTEKLPVPILNSVDLHIRAAVSAILNFVPNAPSLK
ncbi:MAG: amino acid racemase [Verrucomicrobiota bacterium]|nr:amino acid racemase [Verrucomicrobiota bacterium]